MTLKEKESNPQLIDRLPMIIDIYGRVMAAVLMILGLAQWAIILGVIQGSAGMFEAMPTPWKLATMHLAVVDLVASVGLWQRVAWGNVVWVYAAVAEVAMHTVFIGTFGSDLPIVAFHIVTVAVYFALLMLERRIAGH
jgi:Family of unknown function (DUF6163)